MAFEAKVLQTASSTGTTDMVVAGSGTPTGAITFVTTAIANDTAANEAAFSVGFWDGTNMRASNCGAEHNEPNSDTQKSQNDGQYILLVDGNGTSIAIGTVANTVDGVKVTWSTDPVAAYLMTTILFGGTSKCAAGHLLPTTQNVAVSVSGLTFKPNLIIFAGVSHSSNVDVTNHAQANMCLGFAAEFDGAIVHRSLGHISQNGAASSNIRGEHSNTLIVGATGATVGAEVTAFNDDGFDLTRRDATGAYSVQYMAVHTDGDPVWVGDFSTDGAGTATVSTGHKPKFGMAISTQFDEASWDTYVNSSRPASFGIGATDFNTGDEYSVAYADEHNQNTTDTQSFTDSKIVHKPHHNGNDLVIATITRRGSDGFDITYSANVAGDRPQFGLTVGETEKQLRNLGRGWGRSLRNRHINRLG